MTSLHITNGDGAGAIIGQTGLGGVVLPWRDTMHYGPFPAGIELNELSKVRARFFAGPGLDPDSALHAFQERDDRLHSATDFDNVILWFEHDLLDQLQILQIMDWFAEADLGETSFDLICIDRFPGIEPFRGLGQLNAEQMASLYAKREPISDQQLGLAKAGWRAFRGSNPETLLTFMQGDLSALPFLKPALTRHLQEYPAYKTGLMRTERQILELVRNGVTTPGRIFSANMAQETALFIGDYAMFGHIGRLCADDGALLSSESDQIFRYPPHDPILPDDFRRQRLRLTELGREVLDGTIDAFALINRDQWLGGVHLCSNRGLWTWDADTQAFKQCPQR